MFLQVNCFVYFQSYIKIYQGEELPHPKSMLQVGIVDSLKSFSSILPHTLKEQTYLVVKGHLTCKIVHDK